MSKTATESAEESSDRAATVSIADFRPTTAVNLQTGPPLEVTANGQI